MKQRENRNRLDFFASLLGVFAVDWEQDFMDDGYQDVWGRSPLHEPLWQADIVLPRPAPQIDIYYPQVAADAIGE